jgi:hypothetical protein
METLEPVFGEHGIKVPTFRTADDDVLTGRKTGEAGETITFGKGRGRCIAMICPMTLSDAGSFCSVLFPLPASQQSLPHPQDLSS